MCLARRFLLPLLPPREERAGERRAVLVAGAPVCQQLDTPLPSPLPVRSSRGEGVSAVCALNTYRREEREKAVPLRRRGPDAPPANSKFPIACRSGLW